MHTSGNELQVPIHRITNVYQLMCNHAWENRLNYNSMTSLSLYRDLLDHIVDLNLMIFKPTIKSCRAHYIKD